MIDSNVSFKVNNKTYEGYARIVDKSKESTLANAVSELMFSKYGWNEGLIVELTSKYNKNYNIHITTYFLKL